MVRHWLGSSCLAAACLIAASDFANAQSHGVQIGKVCESPKCVGDLLDCQIQIGHADGFGDTIRIVGAWDVVDPQGPDCPEDNAGEPPVLPGCRVPATGNLPIVSVAGNTTCVVGGSLPCDICAGGMSCGGGPAISDDAGVVSFLQNQYVVKPTDPAQLDDQANVRIMDLCDGCVPGGGTVPCPGCSSVPNTVQFTAGTLIEDCCGNDIREGEETCDGDDRAGCNGPCRAPGADDECTCCGDGLINGAEKCDDGNNINTDECRNNCRPPVCGDNILDSGETCDGTVDATCTGDCRPVGIPDECTCCGDGMLQVSSGEQCDEMMFEPGAPAGRTCRTDCTFCGDGTTQSQHGEECDDGNAVDTDGCRNNCQLPECGDNIIDSGETCDGTNAATCTMTCRALSGANACTCCGDGLLQVSSGEQCDEMVFEPGAPAGRTCRTDCTFCGDGTTQSQHGEECDDGNAVDTDGCRNNCQLPECGDNIIDSGETCDGTNAATCTMTCRAPSGANACTCCGDGLLQASSGEQCDEMVFEPGAPAGRTCRTDCTFCGDGITQSQHGEECDDADADNADGCRNNCVLPECGDNIIDSGETCDGTNDATCNMDCRAPGAPNACTCCGDGMTQTGESCDDGDTDDADECRNDCTECGDNIINGGEQCDGTALGICTSGCNPDCTCVPEGGEGCTPGYWKQSQHFGNWPDAYGQDDRVDDVFGVDSTNNPKLLTALSTGGGGENAFLRHAVAALLNSGSDGVDYFYSTDQVIQMVRQAYMTGDFSTPHSLFEEQNEQGCPLGRAGDDPKPPRGPRGRP